jgi:hypothetical protein
MDQGGKGILSNSSRSGFLLQLKCDLDYDLVLIYFTTISDVAANLLNLEPRKLLQGLLCLGYRLLNRILYSGAGDTDYFNLLVGSTLTVSHGFLPFWQD